MEATGDGVKPGRHPTGSLRMPGRAAHVAGRAAGHNSLETRLPSPYRRVTHLTLCSGGTMIREMMFCLLVPAAAAVTGCQHAPVSTAPDTRLGQLVGRDELLRTGRPWLLDALRVARPTYFISRGPTTIALQNVTPMVVVIEGQVLPDIELLRSTPVSDVLQVRRLTVAETYHRYNRSGSAGALEIVLRKP